MTEQTGFPQPDAPAPVFTQPPDESAKRPEPVAEPAPAPAFPFGTPAWLVDVLTDHHQRLADLGG